MGCTTSKKDDKPPSQTTTQKPPEAPQPPAPTYTALYKPIHNTRKLLHCATTHSSAFKLDVSLPSNFKFRPNCGIAVSSKKIYLVGGFEGNSESLTPMSNFMDDCVTVEVEYLTGRRQQNYLCRVGLPTLLIHSKGQGEDLYCVGGCQSTNGFLDQGTPAVLRALTPQWQELPQIASELRFCCPLAVLFSESIYCLGGFQMLGNEKVSKDILVAFSFVEAIWTERMFKFPLSFGCLAAPLDPDTYLVFNIKSQQSNKPISTYALINTKIFPSGTSDYPPDKVFSYPVFHTDTSLYVFSEDNWLFTFNKEKKSWKGTDTTTLVKDADFTLVKDIVPRTCKYYAFHVDVGKSLVREFNFVTGFATDSVYTEEFNEDAGIVVSSETSEILLIGGKNPKTNEVSQTCIAIRPGTNTTRPLPGLQHPQQGVKAVEVEKKIYAIAGFSGTNSYSQALGPQWTPLNAPPQSLKHPTCFLFQQAIYLLGGEKLSQPGSISCDIFSMQVLSNVWKKLPLLVPVMLFRGSAIAIRSNRILVFGGVDGRDEPSHQCYSFDGQQFQQKAPLNSQIQLRFDDPPCYQQDEVFLYSYSGDLFKFDLRSEEWSDEVTEEENSLGYSPRF